MVAKRKTVILKRTGTNTVVVQPYVIGWDSVVFWFCEGNVSFEMQLAVLIFASKRVFFFGDLENERFVHFNSADIRLTNGARAETFQCTRCGKSS